MIESIFNHLSQLLAGSFSLALLASLVWGVMSILLSPCHLSSIPLIIGYIASIKKNTSRGAFLLALVFATGILITIALVGLMTVSLGRLMGDVGIWGNFLVAAIFLVMGLYLLDVISLDWSGGQLTTAKGGYLGALGLGLIFGFGLGPCTFAYLAPVLGVVFRMAQSGWLKPFLLILAFAIGHCSVIALAGGMGKWVQNYLHWSSESRATGRIKKVAGVLVLLGGAWFIRTAFLNL